MILLGFKKEHGVIMPRKPKSYVSKELCLSWKNISYIVEKRKHENYLRDFIKRKKVEYVPLLNKVHGIVRSGTLMAIMGPRYLFKLGENFISIYVSFIFLSGAGKTSLLATISLRIKEKISGEVLINGELVDNETMLQISGFVPQQDLAIESLTVQEHMEFMARMKMNKNYESSLRKERILVLLTELGLVKCYTTKLSQLSCGERKRISLAVQLLIEPSILFCDEPTTGLDSFAALIIIKKLREVTSRGGIVICSIHQPGIEILELFHEIILLSNGRLAFQGNALEALQFLHSLNIKCPSTLNCIEFFVTQLSMNQDINSENQKKVKWICDMFKESIYGQRLIHINNNPISRSANVNIRQKDIAFELLLTDDLDKIGIFIQLKWLIWRLYIDSKRNFSLIFCRFSLYMFIGILLSIPYIGIMQHIDQKAIQNLQGLLYLIITETIFTFNYSVFYTFSNELPLLLRDISSGLYNPAPYYISKLIIMLPGVIIQPFIFTSFICLIVGLNISYYNFCLLVIPVILSALSASSVGYLMSTIFKSINTASLLSVPIDFLTLIFSGLFLQLGNLPSHIVWIKYISHFYYGVEAVSLTQWKEIQQIDCSIDPKEPCISTGNMVLEKYGYNIDHYIIDCLGLMMIFSISHIIGFLVIKKRSSKYPVY